MKNPKEELKREFVNNTSKWNIEDFEEPKQELHFMDDEVECNNCSNLMSLTEDESIYVCYNSECTSCYEPYEEEEPNQDIIMELQKDPLLKDFDTQVNENISFLKQRQEQVDNKESTLTPIENKLIKEAKTVWEESHPNPIEMALFGAKWQQEQDMNKYSEEDLHNAFYNGWIYRGENYTFPKAKKEWFEQFKKK